MIKRLMKEYALTKKGCVDFIKATISVVFTNIALMIPVSLLYLLVQDLYNKVNLSTHYYIYIIGIVVEFILLVALHLFQYNLVYFTTYNESGKRRISLAEKLRKLPLSFFAKKDSADLTSIILNDATTMEHLFSHVMPQFVGSIISTVIIAISLFFLDWRLALAATGVLPISILIVLLSNRVQKHVNDKKLDTTIDSLNYMQEYLETIKDLKMNNYENNYLGVLNEKIDNVESKQVETEFIVAIFVQLAQMILKFGIPLVVIVGAYLLVNDSSFAVLTLFMFLIVVSRIYEPMNQTLINLAAIISAKSNVKRMNELDEVELLEGKDDAQFKNYDIEFKNVSFSYQDNEQVLNNISFTAKQGEITALVGPSGGGKSTVGKLVARFYDPTSGSVYLGNEDISKIDQEYLLQNYSIVFQDVSLFNNTILENIRIGKKTATDEEVKEAAKLAMCDDFVLKLKDGYNTVIGENGSKLSGGERQRISIARALLKDAPIILLDEATASLDVENETKIQQAISTLIKNKTVVIIAHRMRTIENADKIVVIQNGQIVEDGTPKELLESNGVYAKMLQTQLEK